MNDSFSLLKGSSIMLFFNSRLIHTPPISRQIYPADSVRM